MKPDYRRKQQQGKQDRARATCKAKAHFPTRAQAEEARRRLLEREELVLGVYGCTICGGFHFTHYLNGRKIEVRTHRDRAATKRKRGG